MNYKHAYHAGNFADVVKHSLLLQLLTQFSAKQKPYYVLDAYGGQGLYSLVSEEAHKTHEADGGVLTLDKHHITNDTPQAIKDYLQGLNNARAIYDKHVYPGSPWWIANHAQSHQNLRAESFEKIAKEYDALNYQLYQLPIGIHHRDAFEGVPAVIPPKEKRGLIFLDPPFEQEHKDFSRLVELISHCYNKWATGTYVLWYPIKNAEAVQLFYKKMKRTGIKKQLMCELSIYPNDVRVGLNGTGLYLINPPWQFDQHAKEILTYLAPLLKPNNSPIQPNDMVTIKWLVGE